MKRQTQQQGIRKWYGDDFINLQDELYTTLEKGVLAGIGNVIVSGCEVNGNDINAGYVYIDGNICPFDGALAVSFPVYLVKEENTTKQRPYVDGVEKEIEKQFIAVTSPVQTAESITIEAVNNPRLLLIRIDENAELQGVPKSDDNSTSDSNTLATLTAVKANFDLIQTLEQIVDVPQQSVQVSNVYFQGSFTFGLSTNEILTINGNGNEFIRMIYDGPLGDLVTFETDVVFNSSVSAFSGLVTGNIEPNVDNLQDIGSATKRYNDIYASNGTIQTSDRKNKEDIIPSNLGLEFIEALRPVSYKFKGRSRTHYGLIAQQVEENLNGQDFAGLVIDKDNYGLRYNEFIAPMIKAIQELATKVEVLEKEVKSLKVSKRRKTNS